MFLARLATLQCTWVTVPSMASVGVSVDAKGTTIHGESNVGEDFDDLIQQHSGRRKQ